MTTDAWDDGRCRTCGSRVVERPTIAGRYDYKNRCTNEACAEHRWHYCFDDEFLDYYEHRGLEDDE